MGAKYPPSVANIILSKWEQEEIYGKSRQDRALNKRYIDNVIILWRGTEAGLQEFLNEINQNKYYISFSGEWSSEQVNFLDLVVYKQAGKLHTHTFFKETDRNGYIPTHSCNDPKWLGEYPRAN